MSGVQKQIVGEADGGQRIDRWLRRMFPHLSQGRIEKMCRKGELRVDGGRVKSATRIEAGQEVRIPPIPDAELTKPAPKRDIVSEADAEMIRACVIWKDDHIIALNKPPGLPTQGGSKQTRHVDGLAEALKFDLDEKPRLVHRLDKDTRGVLVLARNGAAARKLTAAFRSKQARKLYWAVVVGVPRSPEGIIDLAVAKRHGRGGEKVSAGVAGGKKALTRYRVIDRAGGKAAWVAFEPETGRTHQLRVHAAAMETPILGDGKYGGREAFIAGEDISRRLHLHAKNLRIPHPAGGILEVSAPLPDHMRATFRTFGFDDRAGNDLFQEFKDISEP